jgi:hypothetical protein
MAGPPPLKLAEGSGPETLAGQSNMELAPNPQISEGFLVGGIVAIEPIASDTQSGHQIRLDRYSMADGNVYEMEFTMPADPRSDTAIGDTTPWLVGREGFSRKVNGQFNDMGYPTILVSPVGKALGATLRHSAHNMSDIVEQVVTNSDLRPSVLGYGSSRAAAIALGLRGAEYIDVIAPCFPRSLSASELPATVLQAGHEVAELGKHLLRIGPKAASSQRKTFSTNPTDWLHYAEVIPKLWNGDAGRLSWGNSDTHTHITLLHKDGWSKPDVWHAMAAERPNLTIKMMDGRHLRIPDPKVLAGPFHRFEALAEMRGADGDFTDEILAEVATLQPATADGAGKLGNLSVSNLVKAGFALAA